MGRVDASWFHLHSSRTATERQRNQDRLCYVEINTVIPGQAPSFSAERDPFIGRVGPPVDVEAIRCGVLLVARTLFFPQLAVPTGTLTLPATGPPHPNRGLAMPTRKRTRAQDRAHRVQWERALNRARYAADPPAF